MMNVNDLMLGDWVFLGGVPSRVGLIEANPQTVYVKNEKIGIRVDIEDVDPIPLTAEILEANGFRKSYDCVEKKTIYISNFFTFFLVPIKGKWWLSIYETVAPSITELVNIRYVHELQHIMRLCGIEKEIIIKN